MAGYTSRIKRDIDRWVQAGLIDAVTGHALFADIEANSSSRFSFGAVLSLMAAALFSAAILIFIAANWEEIPRLGRVGMLFAAIAAGYIGGAALKLRGQDAFGDAAWIIAAAAFGASIALIGQMYHLSGDERQAIFVWGAATALAAAALGSHPLTVGASLLAVAWMLMHAISGGWPYRLPLDYPLFAAALYVLSMWTGSRLSRHLLILSLFLFAVILYWQTEDPLIPAVLCVVSVGLFAFARLRPAQTALLFGLGSDLLVLSLLGFLAGIGALQVEFVDEPAFLFVSLAAFAGIIAALLTGGGRSAWLRRTAYAAFIFQLGFIYVVMLGSMLGTAGFFVLGGLFLLALAWFITRMERRFASSSIQLSGEAS